jgi:hypothetical protein
MKCVSMEYFALMYMYSTVHMYALISMVTINLYDFCQGVTIDAEVCNYMMTKRNE